MPIWPFKKRRRSATKEEQPFSEKAQAKQSPSRAATYPPVGATQPIDIPRTSSRRNNDAQARGLEDVQITEAMQRSSEKAQGSSQKENVPPLLRHRSSREDNITALPLSTKLESSPHLRPVDFERPHIPYNFRPHSESQSSIQRDVNISTPSSRPRKLQSRRSAYDNSTPSRRQSSKRSKKSERLREEEIRAMGAHTPIPKRPGEGPLRRDSKKMRAAGLKGSYASLPADDDVDSGMASIVEQRGWEIGGLDVFNPRPAVRLSGTPQYVSPSNSYAPSPLAEMVRKDKEKERTPASRDRARKRETIGNRADDFDASDIRVLMERDAKRRELKKKEQQEKLDKKLRNRNGRNRGDSDRKRRDAEDTRKAEEAGLVEAARQREEEEIRRQALMTPPTDIHPALRQTSPQAESGPVGSGVNDRSKDMETGQFTEDVPIQDAPEDPFTDAAAEQIPTPPVDRIPGAFSPAQTPVGTPLETPFVDTAREVRLSQANTPPLSPIQAAATTASLAQAVEPSRARDLPAPPPITDTRRQSDPKSDRRPGAWATFFRRGGTNLRKPGDAASPPSESSFSNTSRESMRNQPLPPHLIDTQVQASRRVSGTPVRTQSKFREDLPEMPISPPESTLPSPDVMSAAAAAAAARRRQRSSAPVPVAEDTLMGDADPSSTFRTDTPVSPSMRSNRMASMASIDSEGSWLVSGSPNRHSAQSGVNRSIGSLNQRFTGSYEELGGDKDAEYVQRGATSSPDKRTKLRSSALAGAPDEETDEDEVADNVPLETPGDPISMHESVRRQPTLVHRDPRVKSREGLLTEYSEGRADTPEPEPTSAISGSGSIMGFGPEDDEPQIKRASSVDYKGHARQISAGSARLIGLSRTVEGEATPPMPQSPTSAPKT